MSKVEFKNIFKIFGTEEQKGFDLLQSGYSKDQLLEETKMVVGLRDVSLSVKEGEFYVLMGLSGSGKSTLVRHLNRLIEPTAGEIKVDGVEVLQMSHDQILKFRQTKVSMVFQKFALFPHKTVLENVMYGLKVRGEGKKLAREKALEWIDVVGLGGYEKYYPRKLSGGMQQRVGIARALVTNNEIIIMDEPFSALDPIIRNEMQDTLIDIRKKLNKTFLFVTHDLEEAKKLADRMAILKDGEVVQVGKPLEIIENPNCEYVEKFVNASAL